MVGPADDLVSLGYCLLELYIGESWWYAVLCDILFKKFGSCEEKLKKFLFLLSC